ncbi:hypothetical protein ABIB25_001643 [Nakamurella sp. UYEF19]|uniref:PucR family transcriptional regulator n=1 Tax=Nakamurella sp. UYEF19 TaxID=1756392 RepID=UPI0033979E4A
MRNRVQQVVDALGERLRRGVIVDDHMLNMLAASEHFGDADPARMWSLLHRRTRPEDIDYARLRTSVDPIRIEPNAELGLLARVCVPIRHDGTLLGFLWLIDGEDSLGTDQLEDAKGAAAEIAVSLRQELMIQDRDSAFGASLLEQVLSENQQSAAQAATDLLQHGFLDEDGHVGVLVIDAAETSGRNPAALSEAVHRAARSARPGGWLISTTARRATVLVARPRPVEDEMLAGAERISANLGAAPGGWWIAVGGGSQGLGGAAASRRQAMVALSVARRLQPAPTAPTTTEWNRLGAYTLIGQLPTSVLSDDSLPLGLFTLLRSGKSIQLVETVEKFLDCVGDKQRTAKELNIHRTTLYYRLDRIEAITGLSLSDGADRLLLHVAVKLARLAGDCGVASEGPPFVHHAG